MTPNPIIVAIDTLDLQEARVLVAAVSPYVGMVKLGLEFFVAHGPQGVAAIRHADPAHPVRIFLDLKLHDIPNTVAGAVRSAVATGCELLTIHAAGGPAMCRAAAQAAQEEAMRRGVTPPTLLAVTILTSLGQEEVDAIGYGRTIEQQVLRFAGLTLEAGVPGLVCSPWEVAALRNTYGPAPVLVVPGIRPTGSAQGDQTRIMTPAEALQQGATHLVIGRPITQAENPAQAAKAIMESLSA